MSDESVLVGIEFDANVLKLALAAPGGDIITRERWPLPALADDEAWAWEVGGRIASCFGVEGERRSALAVGIAAPGPVDSATGRLLRSVDGQQAWDGLPLVEAVRRHIDVPTAADSRSACGLLAERWQGAAQGAEHVLYISLRGVPAAAAFLNGRALRGAHHEAGTLPAVPQPDPARRLEGRDLETTAGLLADAIALLDPELVLVDAAPLHAEPLVPLLQRVVTEVAPGPNVQPAALGEDGPLLGALTLASTVAFEGHHR